MGVVNYAAKCVCVWRKGVGARVTLSLLYKQPARIRSHVRGEANPQVQNFHSFPISSSRRDVNKVSLVHLSYKVCVHSYLF